MAKARLDKKMGSVGIELPECPVCRNVYSVPIYNCQSGHSLCNYCNSNLPTPNCPLCRQPMTQIRNMALEDLMSKVKVHCPHKARGCIYVLMTQDIDNHRKECIFREMECPLGAVFGKCSWNGLIKDMLNHFKERHPENCNVIPDSEVELDNISLKVDDRRVFLVAQGKMLFIFTMKIDTLHEMAYYIVQLVGSERNAQEHVYEIHIVSKQESRRKAIFFEYCFNYDIKLDEIFRQGKCGIMPFSMLNHFIKNNKLGLKMLIKRIPENAKVQRNRARSMGPSVSGHGGPRPSPRPKFRGPAPQGPGPNFLGFGHNRQRFPSPFASDGPKGQFKNDDPFHFNY